MNGLYRKFNRLAVYKVVEVVTVLVLIIYFIVEKNAKNYSSSRAAAITCTFVLALNLFIFVFVELPMSIKEKYFSSGEVAVEEIDEVSDSLEDKNKMAVMQEDTLDNIENS